MKFPNAKVVVGIWGFAGDVQQALDRFEQPPDRILTSLADAIEYFKPSPEPLSAVNQI